MGKWFYRVMGEEVGPISTDELVTAIESNRISWDTEIRPLEQERWVPAECIEGLSTAVADLRVKKVRGQKQLTSERKKLDAERKRRDQDRYNSLTISTCSPPPGRDFTIIDTVFAFDGHGDAGIFFDTEADPHIAFAGVKYQLKDAAYEMGADAVINCQFEYRVAVATNEISVLLGVPNHAQVIEIFAYGTAIQWNSH